MKIFRKEIPFGLSSQLSRDSNRMNTIEKGQLRMGIDSRGLGSYTLMKMLEKFLE